MKRKSTKFISSVLCVMMLLGILPVKAFAAVPDTRAVGAALTQNMSTRLFAPLVFAMGDTIRIFAEKESGEESDYIDRGHVAYVVAAKQLINMESGKYFAELTLINETGLFTVTTVEDVENYNFRPALTQERVGSLPEWEGGFIRFDMKKTDKIQRLDARETDVKTSFEKEDGFYLVNIVEERNGIVSFYDTSTDISDVQNETPQGCRFHEDGYAIIAIDDGEYEGKALVTIPRAQKSLERGVGNAVIQISEGKVLRVFSFVE